MRRFAGRNESVFAQNCSGNTVVSGTIGTSALRRAMLSAGWHGHKGDANRLQLAAVRLGAVAWLAPRPR